MGKVKQWIYQNWPAALTSQAHRDTINATIEYWQMVAKEREELIGKLDMALIETQDQLTARTLELESLKKKIVERAQVAPIIRAKSAAEIRRLMEQEQEREFEESANGI